MKSEDQRLFKLHLKTKKRYSWMRMGSKGPGLPFSKAKIARNAEDMPLKFMLLLKVIKTLKLLT